MKRILCAALAAFTSLAFGATLTPVQLLNPVGSSSGQVIVSTGSSTAPGWANVPATALSGITPVANGGTGLAALTQYNVMAGNGTSAVSLIGPGASGTIFVSNGAASYPSFQTVASLSLALTTGNLSQFAATTSAQLAGVLSDETGTGSAVFGTSPNITTPNLVGVTNASSAAAGSVGEYAANATSGTSITSGVTINATSISLAPGDWDCRAQAVFLPAASTVIANLAAGITTTSATLPTSPDTSYIGTTMTAGANGTTTVNPLTKRLNVSSTTTVYLVAFAQSVTTSTASVNGYIQCRRIR
jgi:hypothetical protein